MPVRISQIPVEVSIQSGDGKVRVTQIPVEVSIQSGDGQVRVTQIAVETSILVVPVTFSQLFESNYIPRAITRRVIDFLVEPIVVTRKRQPNVFVST